MKSLSFAALLACLFVVCMACTSSADQPASATASSASAEFNAELAVELGADQYGMRSYVMAFLKAGPNRDHDPETARQIQEGHMANIRRLAADGKLILAGPFLDGGPLRGIFLFNVATVEEARALTETDPAVESGRLIMELHPWYGSAALLMVNDIHTTIARENP